MKISIITPTFNSAGVITDCIESVYSQTFHNIEHIIVDGGSTDLTLDCVRSKANRVVKIVSEPDKGIYDALNKGIRLASGDIIGILHSDDTFGSVQTLQHIAESFGPSLAIPEGQKPVDVVYGNLVFVDQLHVNKIVRYWVSKPFNPSLLRKGWMPPHPTVFMRREVYVKHGLFNMNLKCAADYDYLLRVFNDDTLGFFYLPEVITRMRMGGISTKGLKYIINKKIEDFWVLKNNRMPFPCWILLAKNVSKIPQLIFKKSHY
ncbi:MAG TPA: glycosyltransferase family 2 protein [Bacteroidales bacterium]|nr:glycosyltransferase family 2 protein [Bacteroidales bacterium]